jgi:hypothetical protein
MSIPKVGETTISIAARGRRDAFHVPGILVKSHQMMVPGGDVVFCDKALTAVRYVRYEEERQAIVDPFIPGKPDIEPGTLFWVFAVPGSTGPVRHDFDVNLKVDPATHEGDDDDGSCAGCYGGDNDDDEDEDEEGESCKGCYE